MHDDHELPKFFFCQGPTLARYLGKPYKELGSRVVYEVELKCIIRLRHSLLILITTRAILEVIPFIYMVVIRFLSFIIRYGHFTIKKLNHCRNLKKQEYR